MNCIDAAARYLATEPEAVARALALHRRGRGGRCAACGRGERWPCAVAASARRAREILDLFPGAYVEVSPSGTGIHIFTRGVAPHNGKRSYHDGAVEVYDRERFFTVTGRSPEVAL